jgi:hypothetical protein
MSYPLFAGAVWFIVCVAIFVSDAGWISLVFGAAFCALGHISDTVCHFTLDHMRRLE